MMFCNMLILHPFLPVLIVVMFCLSCQNRNPMLPPEAFKPRSPPRLAQYNDNSDDFYDSYYGNNSGSNYEVI